MASSFTGRKGLISGKEGKHLTLHLRSHPHIFLPLNHLQIETRTGWKGNINCEEQTKKGGEDDVDDAPLT